METGFDAFWDLRGYQTTDVIFIFQCKQFTVCYSLFSALKKRHYRNDSTLCITFNNFHKAVLHLFKSISGHLCTWDSGLERPCTI